ncbi:MULTISPECIES: hypothetical protein [Streptomycetaceae]|uniref:hypothetical protein n=1 Tax=Streptomycetaceae TaxID=2062 RepID=UPI0009397EBE|nr:hypothetical protein [Streptomyces sp. CB02056]OKI10497.1 hypothetical protein AMK13_05130 [Streptomyces sp. CB02056]
MESPIAAGETVLPRPVEVLPTPALASATRKLADKLIERFKMQDPAALALAQAAVDPSAARQAAESPERLPVPGGVILAIRTEVWARNILPDPRNPRTGPSRRHPVSDLVGKGEGTRFRPLAESIAAPGSRPELFQKLANQEHLAWAAQQAKEYVLDRNDWRDSIRNQGVMTEVWLAATTFQHEDGTPDVTVPVTAEGSSRVTSVHDLLDLRSADVPYIRDATKLRSHIRKLNEQIFAADDPEQVDSEAAVRARCQKLPALLLVGFEPNNGTTADFGVAVKSLVALRHVDYPKPWGEAAENEALADAVVDEIERRGLITPGKAEWLRGALTPDQAKAAGFSADAAVRAAAIVRLFAEHDQGVHSAVRVAITGQSTRKNITTKLLLDVASSLVMRSVAEEDDRKRERMRKYLKSAFSGELAREWEATFREADALSAAALVEVQKGEPGAATRELAARSAYPLVVNGQLAGDRGTRSNDQPDRRHPGEVIDRMRSSTHGVHQLTQTLYDFSAGRRTRKVDEDGQVVRNADGRDILVTDADLRRTFPPAGAGPSLLPAPENPAELLGNALHGLATAVQALATAVKKVEAVQSDDGTRVIDSLGADKGDCEAWRNVLQDVLFKLPVWQQRSIQRHGTNADDSNDPDDDFEDDELVDVSDDGVFDEEALADVDD